MVVSQPDIRLIREIRVRLSDHPSSNLRVDSLNGLDGYFIVQNCSSQTKSSWCIEGVGNAKRRGKNPLLSVPRAGVEPARVAPLVFETSASTDSAIWA